LPKTAELFFEVFESSYDILWLTDYESRENMKKIALMFLAAVIGSYSAGSQDGGSVPKLFQEAIQAMGGDAFMNVTDMVAEGQYFMFDLHGESSSPTKYAENAKFPDKNRFELGNKKKDLDITVYNLEKKEGWILEGQKPVREANPEEMKRFKDSVKHSIDNIFRFRYKDPQNKLFYLGPGDGPDMMLEAVKLIDPENDEVTLYFDRMSKLPAKAEFQRITNKGVHQRIVDEFSQWHMIQGVNTPMRIDRQINGRRAFQQFILKIAYNNTLKDSFFSKPSPSK
jgi:hypothetical protein